MRNSQKKPIQEIYNSINWLVFYQNGGFFPLNAFLSDEVTFN